MLAARKTNAKVVMCHRCLCDEEECCDTQSQDAKDAKSLSAHYGLTSVIFSINKWYSYLSGMLSTLFSPCSYFSFKSLLMSESLL